MSKSKFFHKLLESKNIFTIEQKAIVLCFVKNVAFFWDTRYIIYLVTCRACGMQGVGHTTNFQSRISNYLSHICKRKPTCNTVRHFLETANHSVEDFRIMGIVQLENPPKTAKKLKARLIEFEGYWQVKLQTLEPYGLNSINEFIGATGERNLMPTNDE